MLELCCSLLVLAASTECATALSLCRDGIGCYDVDQLTQNYSKLPPPTMAAGT